MWTRIGSIHFLKSSDQLLWIGHTECNGERANTYWRQWRKGQSWIWHTEGNEERANTHWRQGRKGHMTMCARCDNVTRWQSNISEECSNEMKNESMERSGELRRAPESSEVGARRDKICASHPNSTSVHISRRNYVGQTCLLCCFFFILLGSTKPTSR